MWEYAPAPESRDIANLKPSYRMFVDGEFVEGAGEPLKTVNPATEEVLAEVSTASNEDVDRAVKAARRAYDRVWGRMPGAERAKYIYRIARMIAERARELAVLESLDNGKPIKGGRSAWPVRSSRGTSRCSWPPGRSRRPSPVAIRSY